MTTRSLVAPSRRPAFSEEYSTSFGDFTLPIRDTSINAPFPATISKQNYLHRNPCLSAKCGRLDVVLLEVELPHKSATSVYPTSVRRSDDECQLFNLAYPVADLEHHLLGDTVFYPPLARSSGVVGRPVRPLLGDSCGDVGRHSQAPALTALVCNGIAAERLLSFKSALMEVS